MKQFLYPAMAAAAIIGLQSCASDNDLLTPPSDGVAITLRLPSGMNTRAGSFGDATKVELDNLQWTVFEVNGENLTPVYSDSKSGAFAYGDTETVNLQLAKGKSYQVAFYTDNSTNEFVSFAEGKISVDYSKAKTNSELEDAFVGRSKVIDVTGAYSETITLSRPFAQLNWGTDDLDAPAIRNLLSNLEFNVSVSKGLFSEMDVISGSVANPVSDNVLLPAVAYTALPGNDFPVASETPGKSYTLLCMNYLLTGDGTVDCSLSFSDADLTPVNVSNAPVKVNYRTNIYGSLITAPAEFNINVDRDFIDNLNNAVANTPAALAAALANPNIETVTIPADLDLSSLTPEQLTFTTHKTINVVDNATVSMGETNRFVAYGGLTVNGGTFTNVVDNSNVASGHTKALVIIEGGDFVAQGATFINDMNFHLHGTMEHDPYNNATISYYGESNVTIKDCVIKSGGFAICGGRDAANATVIVENTSIESNSSSLDNGVNWAYATRITGAYAEFNNCDVKGIQGGLSLEGTKAVINSGTYATYNTEGKKDAFYAVYVTDGCELTINGGEFSSPNLHTNLAIGGTSCVVSGDNDINMPNGSIIIKGGKFSGKPYSTFNVIYNPASGFTWKDLTDDAPYVLEAVAE